MNLNKNLLFVFLTISSFFMQAQTNSSATKPKKNILFLMADDFNYWSKAQGYYPQASTPNLDKLSAKGILFSDAHSSSPVCNPSRNSLWSGYRPSTTGIQGNADGFIRNIAGFADIKTMNQYFKENGYWVYGAGKLYHPGDMADTNTDIDKANWSQRYVGRTGCNGGSFLSWDNPNWSAMTYSVNPNPMTEDNCADLKMVKTVENVLRNYATSANKDKPFFIGCGVFRPHLPWNMPKEFWDKFVTDQLEIPKGYKAGDLSDTNMNATSAHTGVTNNNKWKQSIHAYLASLSLADHNIGILLDAIENSSYKDNTIICFMGDHGWHLGEKERWGKNTLWDAANRTTLIIYDPSAKGNGKFCEKVVSLQDLYPTLVELSGVPLKTDIEGNSLAPLIENPTRNDWDKPVIMSYNGTDYIKTNEWRYIRDANTSGRMLYDVKNDPYEFNNLSNNNQYTAVISKLTSRLDSIIGIGTNMKSKLLAKYSFIPKKAAVPGVIEAEDYDEGGYLQTHYDSDRVNSGKLYRTADATDIYLTDDISGSFHLGDFSAGDWCNYSINDFLSGKYDVDFRVKNNGSTPAVLQIFDGATLLQEITVPQNNGLWQTVKAIQIQFDDKNSIRLKIKVKTGSNVSFNKMQFEMVNLSNSKITANISRKCLETTIITDDVLYLNLLNTDSITTISIYDISGKLICTDQLPGEQSIAYKLPSQLNKGIYLLRVSDEKQASVEKFIVE